MSEPTEEAVANSTWQATRECWAWAASAQEFIVQEDLIDAIAERLNVSFAGYGDEMLYLARNGLALWIKARAWLGGHSSAAAVRRVMESEEFLAKYSPQRQERYLVTRSGREGYVRLRDLTEEERSEIRRELQAEGENAARKAKALVQWARQKRPSRQ